VYNPSPDFGYLVSILTFPLHTSYVTQLHHNPSSGQLLSISEQGVMSSYDVDSQAVSASVTYKQSKLACILHDVSNQRVFMGTFEQHTYIYNVSDPTQFKFVHKLKGHEGSIRALAYDTASSTLITGSFDETIGVWKVGPPGKESETKQIALLKGHPTTVKCVAISPDGKCLVSGDNMGHISVWDLVNQCAVLAFKGHSASITSLELLDDHVLLSASLDQSAKYWRLS